MAAPPPPPFGAKKAPSAPVFGAKKSPAPAFGAKKPAATPAPDAQEEEMDPELAALLKSLDMDPAKPSTSAPPAPPAPVGVKKAAAGTPPPPPAPVGGKITAKPPSTPQVDLTIDPATKMVTVTKSEHLDTIFDNPKPLVICVVEDYDYSSKKLAEASRKQSSAQVMFIYHSPKKGVYHPLIQRARDADLCSGNMTCIYFFKNGKQVELMSTRDYWDKEAELWAKYAPTGPAPTAPLPSTMNDEIADFFRYSVYDKQAESVKRFLQKGAVDSKTAVWSTKWSPENKRSCSVYVGEVAWADGFKVLKDAGVFKGDDVGENGMTPLLGAVNADPGGIDDTPFIGLVTGIVGDPKTNVNAQFTTSGNTALHCLVRIAYKRNIRRNGATNMKFMELLLQRKADTSIKNKKGKTVLDIAIKRGLSTYVTLFDSVPPPSTPTAAKSPVSPPSTPTATSGAKPAATSATTSAAPSQGGPSYATLQAQVTLMEKILSRIVTNHMSNDGELNKMMYDLAKLK